MICGASLATRMGQFRPHVIILAVAKALYLLLGQRLEAGPAVHWTDGVVASCEAKYSRMERTGKAGQQLGDISKKRDFLFESLCLSNEDVHSLHVFWHFCFLISRLRQLEVPFGFKSKAQEEDWPDVRTAFDRRLNLFFFDSLQHQQHFAEKKIAQV